MVVIVLPCITICIPNICSKYIEIKWVTYNGKSINVERFFTPYPLVTVQTGKQNVAEFKIYENQGPDNISHFELAFGLATGESIGMSKAVINWDKTFDGIETVTLNDPENVLENILVATSEEFCSDESQQKCLVVKIIHTFRKPIIYCSSTIIKYTKCRFLAITKTTITTRFSSCNKQSKVSC
jgi:hypothetical protein